MSESTLGILVLLVTSVGCSTVFHFLIHSFIKACVTSAFVASILFQILGYFYVGHLDPFFIIALIVGAAVAFAIAAGVGYPFLLARRNKLNSKDDQ